MKRLSLLFALAAMMFGSAACTTTSPASNVAPLDSIDFSDIETMKKGESCSMFVLGFFGPLGDTNLKNATKDARIRKVRYIEKTHSGFPMLTMPLVYKRCIVAYGE